MKRVCFICGGNGRMSYPPQFAGLPCPKGCLRDEE